MAARHLTATQFLTETGFGQLGVGVVAAFPEYPPHNAKLNALLERSKPGDESNLVSVVQLLTQARQLHEQGNFAGEQQALVQADQLLDQLGKGGPGLARLAPLVIAALFLLILWWASEAEAKPSRKRLPPPRRNARRRPRRRTRPQPGEDDDGDDEAEGAE